MIYYTNLVCLISCPHGKSCYIESAIESDSTTKGHTRSGTLILLHRVCYRITSNSQMWISTQAPSHWPAGTNFKLLQGDNLGSKVFRTVVKGGEGAPFSLISRCLEACKIWHPHQNKCLFTSTEEKTYVR